MKLKVQADNRKVKNIAITSNLRKINFEKHSLVQIQRLIYVSNLNFKKST